MNAILITGGGPEGITLHGFGPAALASGDSNAAAVGDFDGDRHADVAIPATNKGTVTIYRGDGFGNFSKVKKYTTGNFAFSTVATDFDRDGKLDLVVTRMPSGVMVLLGDGHGRFKPGPSFLAGVQPFRLALGDFDRDGVADLGVLNYESHDVTVLPARCGN